MNIKEFLQVLRKNIFYLLFFPAFLAIGVFFLVKDKPLEYKSSTLLYTGVVSGYNLNSADGNRIDYNAIANAFDNLTSISKLRDVAEETSIRLLSKYLMNRKGMPDFDQQLHDAARLEISAELADKLVDPHSYEKTVNNIYTYIKTIPDNPITKLLNSEHPFYGITSMQTRVQAFRKSSSDIIEITFSSSDPLVCQNTLQLLTAVIIEKYKTIKTMETNNVISYFEDRAAVAKSNLQASEQKLIEFGIQHKIINYDEQSKSIATSKASLLEDIEKEKMILSSATASMNSLDRKLNMRSGLLESNSNVIAKRKRLSELNYKIANAEVSGSASDLSKERMEAETVKNEIKGIVSDIYQQNNTQEGLQGSMLLTQWLNNLLTIDESNSRLVILNNRLKEFDKLYNDFAPMGSQLASLQREVSIAEKEYLEVLNALNQSNLRQQNIAHSSNLKVIEPPAYPSSPNALKNKLLVIASFLFGLIVLVTFFFVRELIDSSIQTPLRAEQYSGLKVAGTFPLEEKKLSIGSIKFADELMEQTMSAILVSLQTEKDGSSSRKIIISSLRPNEGKTWCATKLANKLSENFSVALFSDRLQEIDKIPSLHPGIHFLRYKKDIDLTPLLGYDYIIMEVPALTERQIPLQLLSEASLAILVLNAQRSWSDIDSKLIDLFKKVSAKEPLVFLNQMSIDKLNAMFGEVSKKNSGKSVEKKDSFSKETNFRTTAKEV